MVIRATHGRNNSMIEFRKEIEGRLSVLRGLELSGVNRAADMLTLGFGSLRPVTNSKGVVKYVGAWALHVQCVWRLEKAGHVLATDDDLRGDDEKARETAHRLQRLLLEHDLPTVDAVAVNEAGGVVLSLSGELCLTVVPDATEGEEDWRFFAPGVDAAHLVIEGGEIASE
jgi:hypothetical protein